MNESDSEYEYEYEYETDEEDSHFDNTKENTGSDRFTIEYRHINFKIFPHIHDPFLKFFSLLPYDNIYEICSYLSLWDLRNLRCTGEKMKECIDNYVKINYKKKFIHNFHLRTKLIKIKLNKDMYPYRIKDEYRYNCRTNSIKKFKYRLKNISYKWRYLMYSLLLHKMTNHPKLG